MLSNDLVKIQFLCGNNEPCEEPVNYMKHKKQQVESMENYFKEWRNYFGDKSVYVSSPNGMNSCKISMETCV